MRDKTQRRIIVLSACDSSADPAIAAKQLRISVRVARDFADAVAAYSRLSKTQAPKVELAELKTWQETTQQAEPASLVLVFPLAAKSTHACVPSKAIERIVKSLPCPNKQDEPGGAETFEHLYRLPRLGAYRRPISQAIDLLVCAARLGEPLEKAMRSIGHADPRSLVCAQPGLYPILRLHQAIWHR